MVLQVAGVFGVAPEDAEVAAGRGERVRVGPRAEQDRLMWPSGRAAQGGGVSGVGSRCRMLEKQRGVSHPRVRRRAKRRGSQAGADLLGEARARCVVGRKG